MNQTCSEHKAECCDHLVSWILFRARYWSPVELKVISKDHSTQVSILIPKVIMNC